MDPFSDEARFALVVATEAGQTIRTFFDRRMELTWTSRSHFKTAVDDMSEAIIRRALDRQYPNDNVWSEEGGRSERKSRRTWVWDAVDGTILLFTGICDHFSVCGALCVDGIPVLGVANAVGRKEMYCAEVGKGAYCNGKKIRVSPETEISRVIMGIDSGKEDRTAHLPFIARAYQPDGLQYCFSIPCASVPLLLVASGVVHAYLATSLSPEDMAAAVSIVQEAGGKVTTLNGGSWKLGDCSILAANPELHAKLGKFFGIF